MSQLDTFLILCLFLGAIVPGAAVVLWPFGIVLYVLLRRGDDAMSDAVAAYNETGGSWASAWRVVVAIVAFAAVAVAGMAVLAVLSMGGVI